MDDFISWIKQSPQYSTFAFIHGERLFIRENGVFKVLAIQLAYEAFQQWHVQDVRSDVNGSKKKEQKQQQECIGCCSSLLPELIQAIKAQNEVMVRLVDQNSELISIALGEEDEEQKSAYIDD
ncbi:hypothetical protein [uncultured Acinetobacter sp.]|uniref:hypothetical protein n=1 Tax=uncultured Acinetobacter sp. TaxID=165433 RepID=UPI00374A5743